MRNTVITFGIICFCSLVLLKIGKYVWITNALSEEVVIGTLVTISFIGGIFMARRLYVKKEQQASQEVINAVPYHKPPDDKRAADKISRLGISKREYEVLCEVALGHSNNEIAQKLYLSEHTVKTHVSNLLAKLDARRRTDAVRIAKELQIL